ncbi:hypothetical protein GIB67_030104 [Kingdonia uniflora]|uniref:Uncharacterized protein n=1 Tax=Kingdonia uniflora TaxID=39325 RepID=A0A7J7L2K4_9MAGN|nr:hypothetical protein GIB67_030104 [Kingdonia uniflora]
MLDSITSALGLPTGNFMTKVVLKATEARARSKGEKEITGTPSLNETLVSRFNSSSLGLKAFTEATLANVVVGCGNFKEIEVRERVDVEDTEVGAEGLAEVMRQATEERKSKNAKWRKNSNNKNT